MVKAKARKNSWSKTRPIENPYMTIYGPYGYECRVLKAYQQYANEVENRYARWFCAVRSPFTDGSWDYGDVYVAKVAPYATDRAALIARGRADSGAEPGKP